MSSRAAGGAGGQLAAAGTYHCLTTRACDLPLVSPLFPACRVLAGVHPREGILSLAPFQRLESISMVGTARWVLC